MAQPQHGFVNPAAPGAGDPAPRPRDLLGCLVAYTPTEYTPAGAPGNTEGYEGDAPRDRVTVNILVLETPAGPVAFGGNPETRVKPKPHTHTIAGPAKFSGAWISNSNIVKALAPGGNALVGQMVLGRLVESDVGRRPINLMAVDQADLAKAIAIKNALDMGQAAFNEPIPLPGQAAAPAASINYAPSPVPPQPTAWTGAPPPAGVPLPPAPPAGAPPVDPAYAAWLASQNQAAPPPPVVPPHLAAAGWTAAAWASLSSQQQAQVDAGTPR